MDVNPGYGFCNAIEQSANGLKVSCYGCVQSQSHSVAPHKVFFGDIVLNHDPDSVLEVWVPDNSLMEPKCNVTTCLGIEFHESCP